MATVNPFDLLGDDDTDDPSNIIAAAQQLKVSSQTKKPQNPAAPQPQSKPAAKLPSKPLPPAQAVKEAREGGRGGGRGTGRGYGRGGGGFNRESTNSENAFGSNRDSSGGRGPIEEADASRSGERRGGGYGGPHGSFRGGRRSGFGDGEVGDGGEQPPRRPFERRSGTGRGYEMKREGAGRGNWGSQADEFSQVVEEVANEGEKIPIDEKTDSAEVDTKEGNKETPSNETEEKEPENKEMTLEEYEKVLEEKRKALQSLKSEERKVDDKAFATMQPLTNKKNNDEIFVKLGSEKDKKKELAEKEERAKKALSINEFLKPAEGERYYSPGGRGRGGRGGSGGGGGSRGGYGGGGNSRSYMEAPSIEDPGQFPTLGAK